jgi:hypothetical protein
MLDPDAEDLISHLCSGLAPEDRESFRQAAEAALASSPQCWGPGSIHRTLVPLWRQYFTTRQSTTAARLRRRAGAVAADENFQFTSVQLVLVAANRRRALVRVL